MRKFYSLMGVALMGMMLFSCSNALDETLEETSASKVYTRTVELDSLDKGEIIPAPESPYKRKDINTFSINENSYFFDIRELDVNIIVKENGSNAEARFLTSNGLQKEITVSAKNNSANQKFKLYIMPLTGYIYIKDYEGHLVSMGVYSNAPDTRVLYVKDGTSSVGACWDFLRGEVREQANILQNSDAIEQGSGGWMDVYNEVIGVSGTKIYFGKYNRSATQEFEIRVVESFKVIGSPTYNLQGITPEERPDYILRGTVYNNSNNPSTLTIQYSDGAKVTSSFQENKSYTTNINSEAAIKTPIFSIGGGISSSTTYGFAYNNGEEKNISYMFNHSTTVDPYTTVRVTALVKNYSVNCTYEALLEGGSGRRITVQGIWEGISCADVDYNVEILDKKGNTIATRQISGKRGQTLDLTRKALNY